MVSDNTKIGTGLMFLGFTFLFLVVVFILNGRLTGTLNLFTLFLRRNRVVIAWVLGGLFLRGGLA